MHDMVCGIKAHGLPLFISGQTIGPLGLHPRHDEMAARIVHSADVLTVRDRLYSRGYLETIHGLPNELLETFDDAYTLAYEDSKLPHETESFLAADPPVAALNITDYTSETAGQMAYVARICDWLVQQDGVRVVLLSHTPLDFARLHRIYNMCEAATKASVHQPDTREWTGAQLKKAISRCVAAIGGRYHFIVFAGTSNTPFVGMAGNHYSYIKQNGFAEPLGLSRLILGERETWDFETLTARYREAKAMSLDLSSRFQRPSESMARFGRWLSESVLPKVRKT
jgi:polysaccharide pyruvyl transferase WcaK-like protein